MSVEQNPVEHKTDRTSQEPKAVNSALLKKSSPEWRTYVPHDSAAECKFRLAVEEARILSLQQEQTLGPEQDTI